MAHYTNLPKPEHLKFKTSDDKLKAELDRATKKLNFLLAKAHKKGMDVRIDKDELRNEHFNILAPAVVTEAIYFDIID